ncbi:hypothetical protein [Streptococcus mitis]|jgi:hypothetical protein|uniref:Uncharacterized protein n=1 Tax=Streptococcus mitis TaxID=28037 RepID=A0A428CMR3_STRMT|nr:hypothetical protein [Streptococcus mitis]RSI79517.1 hypothetical protein D8856_00285 [Streptococcus mitis]
MKSKTKKKNKNKRKVKVQGNKFIIWLEKHWLVEALLGYIFFIIVAIGVGYLTLGNESIPAPLHEFKYISPLYLNLTLLIVLPYYSWFGSLRGEGLNTLKGFSEVFLYLNGPIFLFHCFVGIRLKHGKGFLPPLISLDSRYVWFPIATYLIFFFIPAILMVILKYNDKKRKNHDKRESS